MTRDEKVTEVAALRERFLRAGAALVATNRGLSVGQACELRRAIKAADGEYKIAKHSLVRRAIDETPFSALDSFLCGPRGLVFGYADPISVAKALVEFVKHHEELEIEGGALEGEIIGAEQIRTLATLPGLDAVRAGSVRMALAPGQRLLAALMTPARRIAGAIEAAAKKLQEAGDSAA